MKKGKNAPPGGLGLPQYLCDSAIDAGYDLADFQFGLGNNAVYEMQREAEFVAALPLDVWGRQPGGWYIGVLLHERPVGVFRDRRLSNNLIVLRGDEAEFVGEYAGG